MAGPARSPSRETLIPFQKNVTVTFMPGSGQVDMISGTNEKAIDHPKTPRMEFIRSHSEIRVRLGRERSWTGPLWSSAFSMAQHLFDPMINRLIRVLDHFNIGHILATKREKKIKIKIKNVCGRDPGHRKAKLGFVSQLGQSGGRKVSACRHEFLAREPRATPRSMSP